MAHCRRCGKDTYPNRSISLSCMRELAEAREKAFAQAEAEIGPLSAETLEAIRGRVKELEREAAQQADPDPDELQPQAQPA